MFKGLRRYHQRVDDLLRAVLEAPDDDAPRLVYADALIEVGDPRGEFIALQVTRTPDGRTRAAELLAAHRAHWLAELPHIADAHFDRGFPVFAKLLTTTDDSALAALDRAPIRGLSLVCDVPGGDHVAFARAFARDPRTARLHALDLTHWACDGWGEDAFATLLTADLENLVELRVGDHDCHAYATAAIGAARLDHLAVLAFDGDYHAALDEHLAPLAALSALETLRFTGCGITWRGARTLAQCAFPRLRELAFNNPYRANQPNRIEDIGAFDLVRAYPELHTLSIPDNRITGGFFRALAATPTSLRRLVLNKNDFITPPGLIEFAASPHLASLHDLWLGECSSVGDEGAIAIATSPHNGGLRSLDLHGCRIGGAGVRALAASSLADQLEVLRIHFLPAELEAILRERFGERFNPPS